jgi:hypothetical protein
MRIFIDICGVLACICMAGAFFTFFGMFVGLPIWVFFAFLGLMIYFIVPVFVLDEPRGEK